MTISKKLTAALLAGIMSVGMAFSSFAALPGDVTDSPYEEAIEKLKWDSNRTALFELNCILKEHLVNRRNCYEIDFVIL